MMRRSRSLLGLAIAVLVLSGHVGNPNVVLDGNAGPYPVRVVVRPPEVIPGQAEISVRALDEGVTGVTVRPVRWDLGVEGAPRPDAAAPVEGEPRLWSASLWLMEFGSYSVHLAVTGARGEWTLIVPVPAVALRVTSMPRSLAIPLIGLGLFLAVGLLSIVGAAVREAVLPPGEEPDRRRRRSAWIARAVALPLIVLALFGGSKWWGAEDAAYGRKLYRPPAVTSTFAADGAGRLLTMNVEGWSGRSGYLTSPLLPDHGKLMHLFLVRQPGLDAFAHLHPSRVDSATFAVRLPDHLPPGEYRLYGDILHESGFAETLTDTVRIPAATGTRSAADADDSWLVGRPAPGSAHLPDASSIVRLDAEEPLRANVPTTLRFRVFDPAGTPAELEPYMGMLAHAAVTREDGSVFVHLHPGGTVSAAAQARFDQIARGDTVRDASGSLVSAAGHPPGHGGSPGSAGMLALPYEFPRAGRYVIWVQVKRENRVLTGSFDVRVTD
ncbi:MAG: hypothetical protein KY464_14070 [Gemmatimonadetes bacterium]|nr:hypothetical protein [Gemmatimonadota bacterium]